MNIAITIWGNRISPVFDAARTLLVVEIAGEEIVSRSTRMIETARFDSFQQLLAELEVNLLICGAICRLGVNRLQAIGIEVVPFLTGEVERILERIIRGEDFSQFAMPGCRNASCRRRLRAKADKSRQVVKAGGEH